MQANVEATSPDGAVTIAMGDLYPVFVEPNAVLSFAGIDEGGTYVDPSGYPSRVRPYAPGAEFLREYVLPDRAPGFEVTSERERARPVLAPHRPANSWKPCHAESGRSERRDSLGPCELAPLGS